MSAYFSPVFGGLSGLRGPVEDSAGAHDCAEMKNEEASSLELASKSVGTEGHAVLKKVQTGRGA